MLHTDGYLIISTEGTIETNDVGRVTLVKDLQLTHYLITHCWLNIQHYHLQNHGERETDVYVCMCWPDIIIYRAMGRGRLMCMCVCVGLTLSSSLR